MNKEQVLLKILQATQQLFDENSELYLGEDALNEDNITETIHLICNAAPCRIYNEITGNSENMLSFNHIANRLCFQYLKKSKEDDQQP